MALLHPVVIPLGHEVDHLVQEVRKHVDGLPHERIYALRATGLHQSATFLTQGSLCTICNYLKIPHPHHFSMDMSVHFLDVNLMTIENARLEQLAAYRESHVLPIGV